MDSEETEESFFVFPEKDNERFKIQVRVFATKGEMIRAYNQQVGSRLKLKNFRAITVGFLSPVKGVVAEVLFNQNDLGPEIIAHEMMHAVFTYGRFLRKNFRDLDYADTDEIVQGLEEWLCSRLQRLVDTVHEQLAHP